MGEGSSCLNTSPLTHPSQSQKPTCPLPQGERANAARSRRQVSSLRDLNETRCGQRDATKKCAATRKIDKWPAAALRVRKPPCNRDGRFPSEAHAAGQFWTFTMSNSKASSFAETHGFGAADRMHVTLTRAALRVARHLPSPARASEHGRGHACADCVNVSARGCARRKPLCLLSYFGPFRSLLPDLAEGFGPPPVSPVFLNPIRVASAVIGNRHSMRT
jgi:hypothetical protein